MSLEDEAWKLDALRRRASGAPEATSSPRQRRGIWGWAALGIIIWFMAGILWAIIEALWTLTDAQPTLLRALATTAFVLLLLAYLSLRDDVRHLRGRVESLEQMAMQDDV